jgi:hypothetical protein
MGFASLNAVFIVAAAVLTLYGKYFKGVIQFKL